jgi:hypothetical protein
MAALKGMTGALAPFSYLVFNKKSKDLPVVLSKIVPCTSWRLPLDQ